MATSAIATGMIPHNDADEPLAHGGELGAARRLFPGAPEPFIDLSTGINPNPYPLPQLPAELFARLPDSASIAALAAVAAQTYRAPSADHVVVAPGTQILLPLVAALVRPGRAAVLAPTYSEHRRAAALAGHKVDEVCDFGAGSDAALAGVSLAMVTHPNNPDGRLFRRDDLIAVAKKLQPRGGVLVADEAFMDVGPSDASLIAALSRGNIVVLRSFGKFFGLAGMRLGFALAAPALAARLAAMLGPWAVSGPAVAVGAKALADMEWIEQTRTQLAQASQRLDAVLAAAALDIVGGTTLFRLVRTPAAKELFHHLGRSGILVRRFPNNAMWLRFGLPAGEADWLRLQIAMDAFGAGG
jgi:cobalamin biosynthetic protein CobC